MQNRTKNTVVWTLKILISLIIGQTLYFKFTGHPESIYIFQKLGVEVWGRYLTASLEAATILLLMIPSTTFFGALTAGGLMTGAVFAHLLVLGIDVQGDGGLLFFLSLSVGAMTTPLLLLTYPRTLFALFMDRFRKIVDLLIGNARFFSLEHRLFNSITLLNAVSNILGSFNIFSNYSNIFVLNFVTGFIFLVMYYFSRVKSVYRSLYWPFTMVILVFLFINSLWNAGSQGGAHYYLIPALIIAAILSRSTAATAAAFALFTITGGALFAIEYMHPDWVTGHMDEKSRIFDVSGQFVFVQIFTSLLVLVLKNQFNQERNKSEKLLLNILPESIADELKKFDSVEPKYYESATVLFTDFVGFTKIAENLSPADLIASLDECFRNFDRVIRKNGLEKIKTIGDAYMAVSGIPSPNPMHAENAVRAALEILTMMETLTEEKAKTGKPYWKLRIGLHSGHLVAGVVGSEKFVYDVWGDTVNTASRLESAGLPGKVNISGALYELVKDRFSCDYRGKIPAKNKGEIDMYFVNREIQS